MWLRTLLRSWPGRRQSPIQTREKNAAPRRLKLMLECLEDRLAPANVSIYNVSATNNQALAFTAAANGNSSITVTAPASDELQIQVTNDTIARGARFLSQ
jgi:hypothetical protein